jgi:hypothetical protein
MAALARSPDSPDPLNARVPCPFCGGLVHPIAGRCKHCKQDVSEARSRMRAGGGALPLLAGAPVAAGVGFASPPPYGYPVVGEPRRRSLLGSWPLFIILLAVAAMIVALVLLILPQHGGSRRGAVTPPSNDHMDTESLPGSKNDPWTSPPRGAPRGAAPDPFPTQPDPAAPAPAAPDPTTDDPPPDDGLGTLGGNPFDDGSATTPDVSPVPNVLTPDRVMYTIVTHLCSHIATCGGTAAARTLCARTAASLPPVPMRCYKLSKAVECVRAIDEIPCDGSTSSSLPSSLKFLQHIPACIELLSC